MEKAETMCVKVNYYPQRLWDALFPGESWKTPKCAEVLTVLSDATVLDLKRLLKEDKDFEHWTLGEMRVLVHRESDFSYHELNDNQVVKPFVEEYEELCLKLD